MGKWELGIDELTAGDLLLDQCPGRGKLHCHFDLLEAAIVSDQSFADEIDRAVPFIIQAEIVVQVHAPFDDLAAAITFHMEGVVALFRFGSPTTEDFFEKTHSVPHFTSAPRSISLVVRTWRFGRSILAT